MITVKSTANEMKLAKEFRKSVIPCAFDGFAESFTRNGDVFTDENGLEINAVFEEYEGAAAIEWTLWLTNKGTSNSRQIKNLLPLSWEFEAEKCLVSYCMGTKGEVDDFRFTENELVDTLRFDSVGSKTIVPFFNLDFGGRGILLALGWTKNWFLEITKADGKVKLSAGMPNTDFYLKPDEKVRSPRVMVMFWEGDKARSYNLLRRHLVRNHVPKDKDGEAYPPICCNMWGSVTTENNLAILKYIEKHGLKYDMYWMDAGWNGADHEVEEYGVIGVDDWWYQHGDWSVNRVVHPDTLKPIANEIHRLGMKFLLWYDFFTAVDGVGWAAEHPEYGKQVGPWMVSDKHPDGTMVRLFNINAPGALEYMKKILYDSMKENGVDCYREDVPPIYGGEDEEGRTGICEMKAVENLYDFWDGLLAKYPDMMIDNCGGGGTRIDLETVSRAYVLWSTDYNCKPDADPKGAQIGHIGIGHFVPLVACAPPRDPGNDYLYRSGLFGGIPFAFYKNMECENQPAPKIVPDDDYPIEWHKEKLDEYQDVKKYFSGDFHVLSDCGLDDDGWASYQLTREDIGGGVIFAFRRPKCENASLTVKPVLENGTYEITDRDTGKVTVFNTETDTELEITTSKPATAVMLMIKKI